MTSAWYAVLAYVVGLGLMAGYGVRLWVLGRHLGRGARTREPSQGGEGGLGGVAKGRPREEHPGDA